MKVLIINSVCGRRSTGRICCEIAKEYIAKGHVVRIAYGWDPVPNEFKSISVRIGNKLSLYKSIVAVRLFDNDGFNSKNATKKFLKFVEEFGPDLIWIHNIHGYYINVKLLFSWISNHKNIEVKWTLHDCWSFTGHCAYFDYSKCEKWKTECNNCPSKRDYPSCILFSRAKQNYRLKKQLFTILPTNQLTIITPSLWLAKLVKESSFLSKYKVEVINNKIDSNIFKATTSNIKNKYGIKNKNVILGVASVWNRRKGFDDFLKLSKIISNEFVIVLIGISKKQKAILPNNIIGIDRTENQTELAQWYSASLCLFVPTYEDNYPTVLLEANSCNCPTYSYDTGGCAETCDHVVSDVYDFYDRIKIKNENNK